MLSTVISGGVMFIVILAIVGFALFAAMTRFYKRCPPNKVLVIFGKVGNDSVISRAKCVHGGSAFVWPVLQDYAFLDMAPMAIDVELTSALSKENIRVNVPSTFTVGIDTRPEVMQNAATRLLGMDDTHIVATAKDIIVGQFRAVIAQMGIAEINQDRDAFQGRVLSDVETELAKIGLTVVNVNIKDITDESGYLDALGKKAAATALNTAKVEVAQQDKTGAMGAAEQERERRISVADKAAEATAGEANADQRLRVAKANADAEAVVGEANAAQRRRIAKASADAEAVVGENLAKLRQVESEATLRINTAEKNNEAVAAENVRTAEANRKSYEAEREAELARKERDTATQLASTVPQAEADKERRVIAATADALAKAKEGEGEGDKVKYMLAKQGEGQKALLEGKAEGFRKLVEACGGDVNAATQLMLVERMEEIARIQAQAISGLKIDKVIVWGGGQNAGGIGGLIKDLATALPPASELLKQVGINLPVLGIKNEEADKNDAS